MDFYFRPVPLANVMPHKGIADKLQHDCGNTSTHHITNLQNQTNNPNKSRKPASQPLFHSCMINRRTLSQNPWSPADSTFSNSLQTIENPTASSDKSREATIILQPFFKYSKQIWRITI